jgi:outer membrane protein, heavy metal efflux system
VVQVEALEPDSDLASVLAGRVRGAFQSVAGSRPFLARGPGLGRRALAGVLLLGLSLGVGCARFESRPLEPAQTAAEFETRSLADAGLRAFMETNLHAPMPSWPPARWGFTNLVLAAFYFHPDLDVARARWAVAQAGTRTAGERPNPTLSVTPAYNTTTHVPSPWLVTPTLDLPIETAGKRGYRVAQASQLSEVARLNVASVAWQVRSRVRRALVDLYTAQEAATLLQDQQALQDENVRLLEQQRLAGAISAFELTQARMAADAARLALREAERQRAEARVQLADAVGLPVPALEGVSLSFAGFDQLSGELPAAELRRDAMRSRPDLLAALADYAAAQSALQLEIAKQYPDVHLNPGYEFDQGDNKWSLGLSVTLPVLNQNRGAIAEAAARRAEAAALFNALQARIAGEIDRALAGYRIALRKQADTDALLGRLAQQERSGQAMLQAGEISRSELAALRLQLGASALSRLDALAKSQQALGTLEDAVQNPFDLLASSLPINLYSSPRVTQGTRP